jgi:hypothetical protein
MYMLTPLQPPYLFVTPVIRNWLLIDYSLTVK